MNLDADAVLALAPDAASAKAARGLTNASQWPTLGADEQAVWGECQGSGAKPYQTQVDRNGPVFKCSCPSRKFPCKHGLALLLLHAQDSARFTQNTPPAWVSEWLGARTERAQKKEEKQRQQASAPADPQAAERHAAKRWARIADAAQELQRWLADQLRRGLGNLGEAQYGDWQTCAARLVDAQAPGLAARVQTAAALLGASEDLPPLLEHLGLLQLACEAIARRDSLDADAQADLRTLVGWPYDRAEVLAGATPLADRWIVLAQITEERERNLQERRVWLHGERSGRRALVLDHAYAGKGFEQSFVAGTAFDGALAFYPGAQGLRALTVDAPTQAGPAAWPAATLAEERERIARRIGACPWTPLHPMVLGAARPDLDGDTFWAVVDGQRVRLQTTDEDRWALLALSGAHPVHLCGEWDGQALWPLAARGPEGAWIKRSTA